MSRNYTKDYMKYGEEDYNIYEGEPKEEMLTKHEDAYYANGGEGIYHGTFDNDHIDAIIEDIRDDYRRDWDKHIEKVLYLDHAADLEYDMSEQEYQHFMHEQYRYKHLYKYQLVLDEIKHYVPDMLYARKMYHEHQEIAMSGNLIQLEKKQLFYF